MLPHPWHRPGYARLLTPVLRHRIAQGRRELKDRFDQALAAVQADGTYERIRAKYFDFDIK